MSEKSFAEDQDNKVACPKCDGSALAKSGRPCRRCNGTGKLEGAFINDVHQFIKANAGEYSKELFSQMYAQHKA